MQLYCGLYNKQVASNFKEVTYNKCDEFSGNWIDIPDSEEEIIIQAETQEEADIKINVILFDKNLKLDGFRCNLSSVIPITGFGLNKKGNITTIY